MNRITEVNPLHDYVVRLGLTDGSTKDVDLDRYLFGPVFEPLRASQEEFRKVQVDIRAGTIAWPNGADIDPDVLIYDRVPARLDERLIPPTGDLTITSTPIVPSGD